MFKNKRISEVMPHLESVARDHGLKLNLVRDFKIAKKLLLQKNILVLKSFLKLLKILIINI